MRAWSIGLLPVLAVALVLVLAATRRDAAVGGVADGRPGPVLLVAGYGGPSGSLEALATALRADGRTAVVVPPVGDNTGDLFAQARALEAAAQAAVSGGAGSVDVVGYSAGGVVVRLWVEELDGRSLARRVVTLGSPHHGTQVAGLAAVFAAGACPEACRQLAPGSDVLAGLPDAPRGPRWTSIWTADDDVVTPPSSARLDGAVNIEVQRVCPAARVSHGALPTDPLTQSLVRLALDGPVLTAAPGTERCRALSAG